MALSSAVHAQKDCQLKIDRDSIRVFTCHTDSSRFKSIIAEFTLHTSLAKLEESVLDIPGYTFWQYNTVEAKVIKKISDTDQIYRTVVEAPWPVTDRDMVVHILSNRDAKSLSITTTSEAGVMPEQKGLVRVPSSRALWTVTQSKENNLTVRYVMQIDPGGAVPAWLANWVCAHAPYLSFKKLKGRLEK